MPCAYSSSILRARMLGPSSELAAHASSTPPETGPSALPTTQRAASTPTSIAAKASGTSSDEATGQPNRRYC
uniref:Uncharacterized protein n=1 Tax=Arundo donax TaxID=35708 RepID=A0A0A9G3D1_ARUDO